MAGEFAIFKLVIYRAKIAGTPVGKNKPHFARNFRYNHSGYYTKYDLKLARKLGLCIMLINDGEANALIYERSRCITGSVMFGPFIDTVFKYKCESIWRALCERKKYKVVLKPDNPLLLLYDVPEGYILNALLKRGTEEIVTTTDPSNLFSGEYPRIGPFVTACGRKLVSETVMGFGDKVKCVHTDGFIIEGIGHIRQIQMQVKI